MSSGFVSYLLSFPPSEEVTNLEYNRLAHKYKDEVKRPSNWEKFLEGAGAQDVLEVCASPYTLMTCTDLKSCLTRR